MTKFTWKELQTVSKGNWIVRPFSKTGKGVEEIETDSRKELSGAMFLALQGDQFDGHDFLFKAVEQQACCLCVHKTPDDNELRILTQFQVPCLLVEDTLTTYQQLASFHRHRFPDLKVIAITGSSGKTSTKEITAAMLRKKGNVLATVGNTNNHIGVPLNMLQITSEHDFAVLELGTNNFGEIKLLTDLVKPDIAMVTNVGAAHLENLINLDGVAREKSSIYTALKEGGLAIIPEELLDNPSFSKATAGQRIYTFGKSSTAHMKADHLSSNLHESQITLNYNCPVNKVESVIEGKWSLTGAHQAVNAAAASLVAIECGISASDISEVLPRVKLPGMRMKTDVINGTTWINDSYNANPSSVTATLDWISSTVEANDSKKTWIVLGDMLELGANEVEEHKNILQRCHDDLKHFNIVAVGAIMQQATALLCDTNHRISCFPTVEAARKHLLASISTTDTVFLKASRGTKLEQVIPI